MNTICFDIGGTSIKAAVFSGDGKLVWNTSAASDAEKGHMAVLANVEKLMEAARHEYEIGKIGVSTAGQVDPFKGCISYATDNIPGYSGFALKQYLEERYHCHVVVENDVNAAALGEYHYGAAKNHDSFLCATYGTGIGGAIMQNGRLLRGERYAAAEWGHIVTHAGGLPCTCKGKGCYEQYASTSALLREIHTRLGLECNGRDVLQLAKTNPKVQALLTSWLQEVAAGLVSLTYIFNPGLILLGGGIMEQPEITANVQTLVSGAVMPNQAVVKILPAALGNRAGLYGMYALCCGY